MPHLMLYWCLAQWVQHMMDSVAKLGVSDGIHTPCMTKLQQGFQMVSVISVKLFALCSVSTPNLLAILWWHAWQMMFSVIKFIN